MSTLLFEAYQVQMAEKDKWPTDTILYQPYQVEQVTLPDYSNCIAVRTFLNMCVLQYDLQLRTNAEEMSPSNIVPLLKLGNCCFSGFDPIVSVVNLRGISLSSKLDEAQKSEMAAYISMVHSVLYNAELYLAWIQNDIYSSSTRLRYGSVHPWPLSRILPWAKQMEVKAKLAANGWINKSEECVYEEIEACLQALTDRLGSGEFFFDQPTELDALVFGHVYNLLTFQIPGLKKLETILKNKLFKTLVDLCKRIEKAYFKDNTEE